MALVTVALLVGVPADHLPGRRDRAVHVELEALGPLAAGLHRARRIGRVRRRRVGPVEPVHRRGEREPVEHVPLGADLVVLELLGLERLGRRRERRELVARARQRRDAVAGVQRDGLDRLVQQPRPRRDQVVGPAQRVAVAVVEEVDREALVARPDDGLPAVGEEHLALAVDRHGGRVGVVVRVGGALPERDRRRDRRGGQGRRHRQGRVVEEGRVAEVVGDLPAHRHAAEQRLPEPAGHQRIGDLGLVQQVAPVGRVVVAHDLDLGAGLVHGAGIHVLVDLVVVGEHAPVPEREPARRRVLQGHGADVHQRVGEALGRIAEEGARRLDGERRALERGDAAVGGAVVLEPLVAREHPGPGREPERGRRVDAVALEAHVAAVEVGVLVHPVEPERQPLRHALSDVQHGATGAVRAALDLQLARRRPLGGLHHPVERAATHPSAEDQGVGALQRLDPLDVVEVAEVLHVVPHPVHEEAGGGVVAPDRGLVPVALTLGHRHPGHVAHDVGHALHLLVGDDALADHGDRLGDVAEQRVGLGRGPGPAHAVPRRGSLASDLDGGEDLCGRVGGNRCL